MQIITFVTNNISGSAKRFADSLSRRFFILQEFQVETLGFEHLKEMYKEDLDIKQAYESSENPLMRDRIPWLEYLIQEGFIFKGIQLCILKCSMRDNLLKENHNGGLTTYFGHDKTYSQLSYLYYCLGMRPYVNKCRIHQYTEGKQ